MSMYMNIQFVVLLQPPCSTNQGHEQTFHKIKSNVCKSTVGISDEMMRILSVVSVLFSMN